MNTPNSEPELVLGTAQLNLGYGITSHRGCVTREAGLSMLEAAWDLGIRTLDTAPAYGDAEAIIGECPHQFAIHTKVERQTNAVESLQRSLQRLERDSVDVLYLHEVSVLRSKPEQTLDELAKTLELGARDVGVSVYEIEDLRVAEANKLVGVVQAPGNVLDRRFLNNERTGIRTYIRSAFLQGILLLEPDHLAPAVQHLAPFVREFHSRCTLAGVNPLVACLSILQRFPSIEGVVVGAQDINQLQSIAAAWGESHSPDIDTATFMDLILPPSHEVDPRTW